MSEEYEDEFPTEPGVPEALTPSAPGAPSIFRTVDHQLGPDHRRRCRARRVRRFLGSCTHHRSRWPRRPKPIRRSWIREHHFKYRRRVRRRWRSRPLRFRPCVRHHPRRRRSPPAPQVAPPAAPRTPSPEEVFAAEERQRVLEARRAPSRVAFDNDAQSLAQQTAADTQSLAQGSQVRAGASSIAPGPHAQFIAQQGGAPGYIPQTAQYELRRGTVINANSATTLDSTLPGGVLVARIYKTSTTRSRVRCLCCRQVRF